MFLRLLNPSPRAPWDVCDPQYPMISEYNIRVNFHPWSIGEGKGGQRHSILKNDEGVTLHSNALHPMQKAPYIRASLKRSCIPFATVKFGEGEPNLASHSPNLERLVGLPKPGRLGPTRTSPPCVCCRGIVGELCTKHIHKAYASLRMIN
jgi:hypothetical protein